MLLKKLSRRPNISNRPPKSVSTMRYYQPKPNPATSINEASSKKKTIDMQQIINTFLFISIVIVGLFATTMSSNPQIRITKSSVEYHSINEYKDVAKRILNKSILNKSKVFFRSKSLEQEMMQIFPEISKIDAIIPLGGRDLTIAISTTLPFLIVQNGAESGIIDEEGDLVSGKTPDTEIDILKLRFASPQQNFSVGSTILTSSEVSLIKLLSHEIDSLVTDLGSENFRIQEILFNVAEGQLEVYLNDAPFYIKFSTFSDAKEQVGAMKATLLQLGREGELPRKYLDVRVPGRVFVQ